jgi:surface antigen
MKAAVLAALLALAGCASTPQPKVHPLSFLSNSFGSNMDSTDHLRANEALESGSEERPVSWLNPITQKRFTVTPLTTFKRGDDDCRTYSAIYGGRTVSGRACRLLDGTWLAR